jgi:hypothetical protein
MACRTPPSTATVAMASLDRGSGDLTKIANEAFGVSRSGYSADMRSTVRRNKRTAGHDAPKQIEPRSMS